MGISRVLEDSLCFEEVLTLGQMALPKMNYGKEGREKGKECKSKINVFAA